MQLSGLLNSNLSARITGTLLLGSALYLSVKYLNRCWNNRKNQVTQKAEETQADEEVVKTSEETQEEIMEETQTDEQVEKTEL